MIRLPLRATAAGLCVAAFLMGAPAFAAEPSLQRVVVAPSAGQLSLLLEMTDETRRVWSQQVSETELVLEAGPIAPLARRQILNAPAGMALIKQVVVEEGVSPEKEILLRVRITLRALTPSSVRVVGRRIYIDLIPPEVPTISSMPAPPRAGVPGASPIPARSERAAAAVSANRIDAAVDRPAIASRLDAAIGRFDEIRPFLLSSTAPTAVNPAVLAALAQTVGALQQSLRSGDFKGEAGRRYQLLVSATALAAEALRPDFNGDRAAKARQAAAVFDAARTEPQ
jgi:hypothetical protein